jgi:predicted permease
VPLFSKTQSLFRNLFSTRSVDADLDEEVRSHLALLTDDNLRAGMTPVAADRAARLELGGIEQVKEQVREERIGNWLNSFLLDCRFAARQLRTAPGFAIVAVLTLALGISINATMFTLVDALLLSRPAVPDADRVAVITSVSPIEGFQSDASTVSVPNFVSWRQASQTFSDMAAADEFRSVNLASQGPAQAVHSAAVSANYFAVLGAVPQLGRTFLDGEDQPGRDHVVVLSHDLWVHRFASDASVVDGNRTIRINRENYTVIGVMPENFRLLGYAVKLWTPLVLTEADKTPGARKDRNLFLFARLKPNVTLEQASAQFDALARQAGESFPEAEKGWGTKVRTLPEFLVYTFGFRSGGAIIMATSGFVLLIACANVSGLLLARAARRRKELGIRIALGAGRLRMVRQLLTENLIVCLLGGGLGIVFAYWGLPFLRSGMNFNDAASSIPIGLDGKVLCFALGITLLCVVLCGLAPALNASRADINTSLKDESRSASASRSHTRLRTFMVAGQVTLALVLLIGTGLLLRAITTIEHQDLGFHPEGLLTAAVSLDDAHYRDAAQRSLFMQDLLGRLRQIPAAQSVAAASDLPATGAPRVSIQIMGQPGLPANQSLNALDVVATTDYLQAAGIPLSRGRNFTELDNPTAPRVVLVNQQFVHRILKDQEPLGQRLRVDAAGAPPEWREIVGVVGDVKSYSEDTRFEPQVYEPFLQRPVNAFSFMLRSTSDPDQLSSALRGAVAQVDPELPLDRVMSMQAVIKSQRGGDQLFGGLLGGFAFLALVLAAIGIYGLVSYSVNQRTHEIGIRLAMGAEAREVLRMVLWQGAKISAAGAAVGLLLSLPLPKLFESMFFSLHFREVRLFVVVPAVILLVAALATYFPARRASSVDPMAALRQD